MAGRFNNYYSSRPGYYDSGSSHLTSDAYRSHARAHSEHTSRNYYTRAPKSRSHTLNAFVEDEPTALAKEHNPNANDVATATKHATLSPGEIDQIPILLDVDENPERRFVLVPGAAATTQASGAGSQTPAASAAHPGASVNASTGHDATPPASPAAGVGNDVAHPSGSDSYSRYEANTCRKFVVVPTGAESATPGPSAVASDAAGTADNNLRPHSAESEPKADKNAHRPDDARTLDTPAALAAAAGPEANKPAYTLGYQPSTTAAPVATAEFGANQGAYTLGTAAALAAAAAAGLAASSEPGPDLRRHRSRADLERIDTDIDHRSKAPNSGRPQTATSVERRPHERARSERTGDKIDRRDNDFLSPAVTMHSTNGRDRAYFDPSAASPSRDDFARSHASQASSPLQSSTREPTSPRSGTDRQPSTPPMASDRDRERERDERDRDRDREREWERDRERERERDSDRHRRARRDSNHRTRRDSDVYSSDDRPKTSATANTPIRRRNSERRRHDSDLMAGKASSSSISVGGDAYTNGRPKPLGAKPLAAPNSYVAGSPPKEPRPPSPTKSYREGRRNREDRRARSPSSTSSSPESRTRIPEGDRPRGPRPRAHAPNVVHNPASASSSLPNLPLPTAQARAPVTVPVPTPVPTPVSIPIPIPLPMAPRGSSSAREEGRGSYERRSSVDMSSRVRSPFASSPARSSAMPATNAPGVSAHRQSAFYTNGPGDDARDRFSERAASKSMDLPPLFLKHAEDVYYGRVPGLPECLRQHFDIGYRDWRTLLPFDDFYICPKCYDAAFAHTRYRDEWVPAPLPVNPNEKTRCMFGSMYWYRVAFFFIETYKKSNLNLLRVMFDKDERLRLPCSGPMRVMGRWFTMQDPVTAHPIPKFSTCEQCATAIQILFPRLKGLLADNDPSRFDTTNICALYFEPDRRRLWKYIDVFETAHNDAVATNRPVDANNFVNRVLDIGYYDECRRDLPVRGRKWYWMRSVPDFIVCQECFQEAVFPRVNTHRMVAGDFFKEPKELKLASCHLYSPRMREIFLRACQTGDKEYLAKKLRQREQMAANITDRIHRLHPDICPEDPEHKAIIAEWRRWE